MAPLLPPSRSRWLSRSGDLSGGPLLRLGGGGQGEAARASRGSSGAAAPTGPVVPQEAATARVRRAKRGSQFSDSMARLRAQGVLKDVVGVGGAAAGGSSASASERPQRRLNRSQSQFQSSMAALKQQWDSEDTPSAPGQSQSWQTQDRSGYQRGAAAAALAKRASGAGPDAKAEPGGGGPTGTGDGTVKGGDHEGLDSFFFDGGGAEPASEGAGRGSSHWNDVSYTVVSFVCFEDGRTHESQEFPLWGSGENLEVGRAVVTWDGLKLCSTTGVESLVLPYDKILLWTINSNHDAGEYFVDLTLEGDYIDKGPQKQVEWWTGNVLEIRCCTADTSAAEAFATSLKEVCQIISEVKLEELDLSKMTGSKIAKASRDMISSTTTFEDARARRISLAQGPPKPTISKNGDPKGGAYMSSDLMNMLQPSETDTSTPKRKSMMARMFSKK